MRDAALAQSGEQSRELWRIRETIPEAQFTNVKHDVSVPVSRIAEFIDRVGRSLHERFGEIAIYCFGHVGDGNLHYNAFVPGRSRADAAAREAHDVTDVVYDVVHAFGGSFSAEHGVGLAKVAELKRYKSPLELELMHAIKRTLDPQGLMNPGKVLEEP